MKVLAIAALGLLLMGQAPPPAASINDLAWLSGRWLSETNGRWTEESWSSPRGGVMLGHSRAGRGDAMREFEFLRIAPGADGALAYVAQPGGRPPVVFRLVARDAASATFENPQHDFPQRIRYVRDGESLTATISRIDGTGAMMWTFRRQ